MDIKITGLDQLQKHLDDASRAFQALDGELATVKFNPSEPTSVEAAIIQIEQAIDAKIARYRGNDLR